MFLKKGIILGLGILIGVSFTTLNKACAHQEVCEKCSKCPLCSLMTEETVHESKEKLIEIKQKLEEALTTENLAEMGQKAVQAMSNSLEKVNEKLDSMTEKETSANQTR